MTTTAHPAPVVNLWFTRLFRVLMALAIGLLALHLVVYTLYAINLIQFPFDYDQGEGFELVDTILFSQGQWPYRDTNVYPFYSSNYPPVYHLMAAPFVWVFGPAYWYGRLLGFLSTLVAATAIGLAVYREGRVRWIAVAAGLAFLASNTVYHIGPLFRQHMTMVMFETLAVIVLANASDIAGTRERRRTLLLGMIFLLLAGYTKQLAIATAAAAFIFLFLRNPRRALVWGIGFALVGGGIFVWMNWATQGQWWLQTIAANVNPYLADQTVGLFRLWFSLHGFLIVPAALMAAFELYFTRLSLYTVWLLAAVANSVLSGKWGAGDSYFATAIAATCIVSGIFFSRLLRGDWRPADNPYTRLLARPLRAVQPALVAAACLLVPLAYLGYGAATIKMPTTGPVFGPLAAALGLQANADNDFYDSAGRIAGGYADIGHFTTPEDAEAGWAIVDRARASDGPILSEEAAFALWSGNEVVTNPTQLLNLSLNNQFDSTELVRMIEEQAFGLVILRARFYPQDVIDAIFAHYEQTDTIRMNGFDYMLLERKARP
jgi:4-amino-4-deoxy-L-arabinose transferase-like glycosyltransferase